MQTRSDDVMVQAVWLKDRSSSSHNVRNLSKLFGIIYITSGFHMINI